MIFWWTSIFLFNMIKMWQKKTAYQFSKDSAIAGKDMGEMEAIQCDFRNQLKHMYSLLEPGMHNKEVKEILECLLYT